MTQPPYRRIADEIRARIADGELRPGDPVPSARGITREWGVALATATKVLATLNAEGVTRSLAGRGTVVAGPAVPAQPGGVSARAARRNEGDPDLTRERIVAAAIRVADAEGLRALDGLGLTIQEMMYIHTTLFSHVRGLALNLEAEAQAEQDSGLTSEEWMQTQEHGFRVIAGTGDFPLLNRLVNSEMELDLDQLFEFGLGRLLDGLERLLAGR